MGLARTQYVLNPQMTPVRVVNTGNLAGNYYNGQTNNGVGARLTAAAAAALVIDGVTLEISDRVLLTAQTSGLENGLYIVIEPGDAGTAWVLERSKDWHSIEQMKIGQYVTVGAGTTNAGSAFVLTEPLPGAVGVDDITWTASPLNSGLGTAAAKAASDNAEPSVASVSGATVIGNLAEFSDVAGTVTDSGVATADVQLNTNIIADRTADIGGGGAGPISVAVAGLTAASIVNANINTSTNTVSVAKVTATATGFDILFDGDPGAACEVNYIAFIAAQ